jgi:hypothetical protein
VTRDQPDSDRLPRPASTEDLTPASSRAVDADRPTMVLKTPTAPPEPRRGSSADQTQRLDAGTGDVPLIDRAGDALARQPRDLLLRFRRLEEHQRGALAAVAALAAFLILVAILR